MRRKNDAKSWLPADSESTKVLDIVSRFQSPKVFAAMVLYDHALGLTAADRVKATADARKFGSVAGW